MWQKFKNLMLGLSTYADMSPDLGLRRQITQTWQARPVLIVDQWYSLFGRPLEISQEVTAFVYRYMTEYSGLPFAKVVPTDRLEADLHLSLVCWFDWEVKFCQDFADCFGVDISLCFDLDALETVADLLIFLDRQIPSRAAKQHCRSGGQSLRR
jgi:hypothetical protein